MPSRLEESLNKCNERVAKFDAMAEELQRKFDEIPEGERDTMSELLVHMFKHVAAISSLHEMLDHRVNCIEAAVFPEFWRSEDA